MVIYDSSYAYITSRTTLTDRIVAIDNIILALNDAMLKAALNENVTSLSLDNGQTKVTTMYRSTVQVAAAINALETTKQNWINQLNGRAFKMVDGKNFIRTRFR